MQIKFLNTGLVSPTSVIIFLGRRKSGKTVGIFTLLHKFKDVFKSGLVFCGSIATAMEYRKIIPGSFIYDTVDPKVIKKFIARQERAIQRGNVENTFILLDDCGFDSKQMNNKAIRSLFQNGRHYKICTIISLQYCLSIGPSLRSNCDFLFACREKSITYRAKLFEHFNICFRNTEEFDECYRACTTNYEIFVMANALPTSSDRPEDNVFYWKAQYPVPRFKINERGRWWALDAMRYSEKSNSKNQVRKIRPNGEEKKTEVKSSIKDFVKIPSINRAEIASVQNQISPDNPVEPSRLRIKSAGNRTRKKWG